MKHAYQNIYDLCHSFFYNNDNDERCYTNNASYRGNKFMSYGTCIGYVVERKGEKTLLVSDWSMSPTTGKQIGHLKSACRFGYIPVPFYYGESLEGYSEKEILNKIASNLTEQIVSEMKRKYTYTREAQRRSSEHILDMAKKFTKVTGVRVKGTAKFEKYLEEKLSADNIKKAAERVRKAAQAKAEKTRKAVAEFKEKIKNSAIYPMIQKYCFDFKDWMATDLEKKNRKFFIDSFGVDHPSFVVAELKNGTLFTTQRVRVSIEDAKPLLKAWKLKHNIVGLKLGQFTILANNDKYVKIGCHNIPVGNIKALVDILL